MKLSVVSIEKEGIVRIASDGNITAEDFTDGNRKPLEVLLGENWASQRVLLNFDQTPYIDSSAIGWLITCQRAFKEAGGTFIVHSVRPSVRQVLDLLKVGRVVSLAADEAAARELIGVQS